MSQFGPRTVSINYNYCGKTIHIANQLNIVSIVI